MFRTLNTVIILLSLCYSAILAEEQLSQSALSFPEQHDFILYELSKPDGSNHKWYMFDFRNMGDKGYFKVKIKKAFEKKGKKFNYGQFVIDMRDNMMYLENRPKQGFMSRGNSTRDLACGTAGCLGGILAIQIFGKEVEYGTPPDGAVVVLGDKYADGAGGYALTAVWAGGIFLMLKGFFESLMTDEKVPLEQSDLELVFEKLGVEVSNKYSYNVNPRNTREIIRKISEMIK